MQFETILFDLDGTLTDPGLGITNSILHALDAMGMPQPPRQELYRFIGPPLLDEFQKVFHVSPETSQEMLVHFRSYFEKTGIYENEVYPGIEAMLEQLADSGKKLVLATSKPEVFAEEVLRYFSLRRYFHTVAGSTLNEAKNRTAKPQVVAYALEKAKADRSSAIMVGDRRHDVEGAHANGLPALGVLYGYGSREELQQAGAEYLAETVERASEILLG